jgi:hypothetical protein
MPWPFACWPFKPTRVEAPSSFYDKVMKKTKKMFFVSQKRCKFATDFKEEGTK